MVDTDPIDSFIREILDDDEHDSDYPLGYRFHPEDHELLDYLLAKIKAGQNFASEFIVDLDVYQHDPHQLPLHQFKNVKENEGFFFMVESKKPLGASPIRTTPSGYWQVHEENVPVYRDNKIMGFKSTYFFHDGVHPNGNKTGWKMIEYRCHPSLVPSTVGVVSYVVCRVRLKKRVEEIPDEDSDFEGNGDDGKYGK